MSAYTMTDFITHATAGDPIKIVNVVGNTAIQLKIGGQLVSLDPALRTTGATDVNGEKAVTLTDNRELDLGNKFTATQVLESFTLRQAILDGSVEAYAGTTALSKIPTT